MPHVCFARSVPCALVLLASVFVLGPGVARAQSIPRPRVQPPRVPASPAPRPPPLKRHWRNEWFRDRDYFDPLIAEPRAPQIAFTFPAWIPELRFSVEPGTRLAWEVSLGREIPIFTRANFDDATRVLKGSQGFGLWVDVSFHMIEDMGKDPSNPIINTDYRFSLAKLKYYRVISVSPIAPGAEPIRRWKSIALRGDLYHHESTHLGDEFVINAQGAHPGEFERQNVSFEFYDIAGAFNWERGDGLRHSIRGGTTGPRQAVARLLLGPHARVPGSARRREVEAQLRAVHPVPVLRSAPHEGRRGSRRHAGHAGRSGRRHARATPAGPVRARSNGRPGGRPSCRWTSAAHRARLQQGERGHQGGHSVVGQSARGYPLAARQLPLAIKEIYARVYHGVNPHGQLRNQKDYWLAGFGVNFAVGDR